MVASRASSAALGATPRSAALGLAIVGLVAGAACRDDRRVVRVRAPVIDLDLAFPVIVDALGEPRSVLAPLSIRGGVVSPSDPTLLSVDVDRETLVLVGLTAGALSDVEPAFVRARLADVELRRAAPPETSTWRAADGLAELPIPSTAALLALEDDGLVPAPTALSAALVARLSVTVPIDPEHCSAGLPSELHPFGVASELLPDATDGGALDRVVRVDDDHLVGVTRAGGRLHVLTRGGAAGPAVTLPAPEGVFAEVNGLAYDAAARRVLVAGRVVTCAEGPACETGTVWEVSMGEGGLEGAVTSTRAAGHELTSVAIDRLGRALVTGTDGLLLVRDPGTSSFVRAPALPTHEPRGERADLDHVIALVDPAALHAIAGVFRIFAGDATVPDVRFEAIAATAGQTTRFRSVAEAPDGELWVVARPSALLRGRVGRGFTAVEPRLPPRYAPCAD
ncbi:hypothetical protein L6R52_17525, partial [Myxococcota bacterium]|nr:hypothetical protein [Myxococcota bacterium]